jgi:hypothetical protein
MDEIEITLGQRALPSVHGEQTTASAYAGLGARHVFVLTDGTAGEAPSRLAAQTAATAALARIRASVEFDQRQTIDGAFAEARQAVRRALTGSALEGRTQVAMVVVILDAHGLIAARSGKGRVYLLRGDRLEALFQAAPMGGLDADLEVRKFDQPLALGDRLLILSESTVRPLAADLERLARGGPAQLAASRLADAARRRGQLDALSVHLIEASGELPREGPHPALARISRDRPRTFDPEGNLLGRPEPSTGLEKRAPSPFVGLLVWFCLAALVGTLVALGMRASPPEGAPSPVPSKVPVAVSIDPAPPAEDVAMVTPEVAIEEVEVEVDTSLKEDLSSLFEAETPSRLARQLRNHITRNYPEQGDSVFERLESEILDRRSDRRIVEALLELVQETELKRTSRWATTMLQKLYEPRPATD